MSYHIFVLKKRPSFFRIVKNTIFLKIKYIAKTLKTDLAKFDV